MSVDVVMRRRLFHAAIAAGKPYDKREQSEREQAVRKFHPAATEVIDHDRDHRERRRDAGQNERRPAWGEAFQVR